MRPILWIALMGTLIAGYFAIEPAIVTRIGVRSLDPARTGMVTIEPSSDPEAVSVLAPQLSRLVDRFAVPGVTMALVEGDRLLFAGSAGVAELETGAPLLPDTPLPLGEVSEIATVTLAAVLVEEGAVDPDTPVGFALPALPSRYGQLSLTQLLSHTGGVPGYGRCICLPIWEAYNRRRFPSLDVAAASRFLAEPLTGVPGEEASESAYGYTLAGMALAEAARTPYRWALAEKVAEPFGLESLKAVERDARRHYLHHPRGVVRGYRIDPSDRLPGAGLAATAGDAARLGALWADGGLLAEVRSHFLQPVASDDPDRLAGWRRDGRWLVARANGPDGAAMLLLDPEAGRVLAILFNSTIEDPGALDAIARQLIAL